VAGRPFPVLASSLRFSRPALPCRGWLGGASYKADVFRVFGYTSWFRGNHLIRHVTLQASWYLLLLGWGVSNKLACHTECMAPAARASFRSSAFTTAHIMRCPRGFANELPSVAAHRVLRPLLTPFGGGPRRGRQVPWGVPMGRSHEPTARLSRGSGRRCDPAIRRPVEFQYSLTLPSYCEACDVL